MRNIEHFSQRPDPEHEQIENNPEMAYFAMMGLYEKYQANGQESRSQVTLNDQTLVVFRKDLPSPNDPDRPSTITALVNIPTDFHPKTHQATQWSCASSITLAPHGATALSLPAENMFIEGKPIEDIQPSGSAGYSYPSVHEVAVPMVDWITRVLVKNEYLPPPRFSFPTPR